MAIIALVLFGADATVARDAPSGSDQKFISTEQPGSTLFRLDSAGDRTAPAAKKCGYILILGMPEIDPRMIKQVPEQVKTTMPVLQGLLPCSRDSVSPKQSEKAGALLR